MTVIAASSLIDRIKKLMTLADRATNPHEAELAASRMQDLLTEHNLTRAEVEGRGAETADSPLTAKRERVQHNRSAMYKYQRDLMETIAENNFCMYILWSRTKVVLHGQRKGCVDRIDYRQSKVHVLIGRSENVLASTLMYDYLLDAMHRINPFRGETQRASRVLWFQGCAESLCDRLTTQRTGRERQEEGNQTPGLVRLVDLYGSEEDLNNDFKRGWEMGTTTRKRLEEEAEEREWQRQQDEQDKEWERKEAELIAAGTDADDAWYLARGQTVPSREPGYVGRGMIRRRAYSGGGGRYAWVAEAKARERRESPAFNQGRQQGREIGLGGSLKAGRQKALKD